jgi:multiple antibiotic resistance protein
MGPILAEFIFFFAVIDPIGTVPVFISVTKNHTEAEKRRIAFRAFLIASFVLLFFVVGGEVILRAMEVELPAFEIAGGIVLLIFALSMIFGESKASEELKMAKNWGETAAFPLAIPSIASPGAMLAAVLLTENDVNGFGEQALTSAIMLSVLALAFVFMLAAGWIGRLIGNSGAIIVSRIMGLILASVAVSSTLKGIKIYFEL